MSDTTIRSVAKTISWRLTGSGATFLITWAVIGSWSMASSVALLQLTVNTLLYFVHERVWSKVSWGSSTTVDK